MRLTKFRKQAVSFADCEAILLMSRWRAILSAEYMSVSASTPIQYSTANTPLVGTRKERTFPSISTEKCPVHINIFVAYLLHMCCI